MTTTTAPRPFAQAYPPPWRIQGDEIVDRDGVNVQDFARAGDPGELVFWQGVVDAVNAGAAAPVDITAPPDMTVVYDLSTDAAYQAALQRYAHANGSSAAITLALLTAARFWTHQTVLRAAIHALRSYQYGNGSPDLAKSIADICVAALQPPAQGGA